MSATPPARRTSRIVLWSLAAVCSILALAFFGIPFAADRLAPIVPVAVEQRIGEAVDKQVRTIFGGKTCDGPDGHAAFRVAGRQAQARRGDRDGARRAACCQSDAQCVRAAGGKIYLLDGLLQKARTRTRSPACSPTSSGTCITATACAGSSRPAERRS
jgi:hypothetical protein